MKNLFLCSYFTGVKDIFKDFMSNDSPTVRSDIQRSAIIYE